MKGRKPPQIERVCKRLESECRDRKGHFLSGEETVRPLFKRASQEYQNRATQQRLVEFLFFSGVLIADPVHGKQRIYFDRERAAYIIGCCENSCKPGDPSQSDADRIQRILSEYERSQAENLETAEAASGHQAEQEEDVRVIIPPPPKRIPPEPHMPSLPVSRARMPLVTDEALLAYVPRLSDAFLNVLRDTVSREISNREKRASLERLLEEQRRVAAQAREEEEEALRQAEAAERVRLRALADQKALEAQLKSLAE